MHCAFFERKTLFIEISNLRQVLRRVSGIEITKLMKILEIQNLLLQPASADDLAAGHPPGIPVLKVADFGFARWLPSQSMAETLCGSP